MTCSCTYIYSIFNHIYVL